MDFHWGIAFFLFGKKVIPVESRGNRTAADSTAVTDLRDIDILSRAPQPCARFISTIISSLSASSNPPLLTDYTKGSRPTTTSRRVGSLFPYTVISTIALPTTLRALSYRTDDDLRPLSLLWPQEASRSCTACRDFQL